jgi:hypothetical protein
MPACRDLAGACLAAGTVATYSPAGSSHVGPRDVHAARPPYGHLMKRSLLALMVTLLLGAAAAGGCSLDGDGDKAGGSNEPTVLRLGAADDADQPEEPG